MYEKKRQKRKQKRHIEKQNRMQRKKDPKKKMGSNDARMWKGRGSATKTKMQFAREGPERQGGQVY